MKQIDKNTPQIYILKADPYKQVLNHVICQLRSSDGIS